jgi:hypothetical protein
MGDVWEDGDNTLINGLLVVPRLVGKVIQRLHVRSKALDRLCLLINEVLVLRRSRNAG